MSEGWKCPVCNRGVRPDKDTCDHGGGSVLGPQNPPLNPFQPVYLPSVPGTPDPVPWWAKPTITCGTVSVAADAVVASTDWRVC